MILRKNRAAFSRLLKKQQYTSTLTLNSTIHISAMPCFNNSDFKLHNNKNKKPSQTINLGRL